LLFSEYRLAGRVSCNDGRSAIDVETGHISTMEVVYGFHVVFLNICLATIIGVTIEISHWSVSFAIGPVLEVNFIRAKEQIKAISIVKASRGLDNILDVGI